jgi:acyl transferase domain-containing protein/phytoene dehydrogenase-like protein/NADP-dependent 3-hydroxy acid dehydrogenase YdfG/acyl-CoA thioesterase FadM
MEKHVPSTGIAIIGMACRYPGADNIKTFWENILTRKRQFRTMPDMRLPLADYYDPDPAAADKTYNAKAALIDGYSYDWAKHRTPKSTVDSTDIAHWLALDVALQAVQDAGFSRNTLPKDRSGTILGNTLTGEQTRAQGLRLRWPFVRRTLETAAREKGLMPKTIDELLQTMETYYKSVFAPITEDTLAGGLSNTIAGRICNNLDIHGGGYTVDGACSSSLIAVYTAANALNRGDLDIALAGGVDISLDTFELVGFAKTGALTKSDMTVYDRRADGFFPGEGCGFVVLQRLEDALKERKNIYAILRGWGISSDGKGGLTAPSARGQALALERAYDGAGYSIREVDFFEGHGTGTPVGDKAEVEALAFALGEEERKPLRPHGITSLKSIIGHTKAASGIGGFIKAVIAVNRRVLPPTANCAEPAEVFNETGRSIYPILTGDVLPESAKLRAGISAMGFGGINCHVTIESNGAPAGHLAPRNDERKLLASSQETELFVLGASSIATLRDRARKIHQLVCGISEAELVDLACKLSREFTAEAPVRAAIITGSPEVLLESLAFLEKKLAQAPPAEGKTFASRRKDIYIGNRVSACTVGFLFPGQGSQLLNMGKMLVDRHDWAQELVYKVSEWLSDAGGPPVVQAIFRPLEKVDGNKEIREWQELLKQTETAQPAICLTSLLWMEKLARLGIRPDVVAGHSLGELTAFQAAGVLDAETLIRFALFRGRAMTVSTKQSGAMASLACPVETATEILNSVKGYVVVANINSPKQTVISGERKSVAEAVKLAKSRDITTHTLRTSNAFHSKFSQKAADLLRTSRLIPQTVDSLAVKIFSGMNGMEILPGHNLPGHFADQAVTPVNFLSLVEAMAGECDLLLEVGPGKILSGLAHNIIQDQSPACLPVEADPGQYRDFNIVLGNYFVRGGKINWPIFFEDRLIRPFIPAAEKSFIESPCERPFKVPLLLKQFDSGTAEIIESALAAAVDISPRELAEYLRLRGAFLESIIKADIQNLPQLRIPAASLAQTDTTASVTDKSELPKLAKQQKITEVKPGESVEDLLYGLIEKRTGFPPHTLSPELRLLDDLNLDSIKAGDLLAEITIQLKVAGDFDVSRYANATLKEIINAFGGSGARNMADRSPASSGKPAWDAEAVLNVVLQSAAKIMGRPVETIKAEARLASDFNLSVEQCGDLIQRIAHELGTELNVDLPPLRERSLAQVADIVKRIFHHRRVRQSPSYVITHRPWVREIHGQLIETPALFSEIQQERRYEDNWRHARVLVLSSEITGSVAAALQAHLNSLGAEVALHELRKDLEPDMVQKAAEYSHLILLLPQEVGELGAEDVRLAEMIARLASIASPPPAAAGPRRRTTVAYIQFGGGRFGMHPDAGYLNRCCASALAKSLHLERDDLRVRVLDFDPTLPALTIAETIAGELQMVEDFAAVGYDLTLTRRELKQRLLSPAEYQDRPFCWSEEDVILVTGGAKGITAACALGVSRATGASMALLGRSPHPDDQPETAGNKEIAATLREYVEAGLTARYYCCDVSDRDSVKKAVRQIRATMGPITGVIHGAGLNVPRLINQVSIQEALQEVSPKILGIINLTAELQDAPPRLFVGLSSIIGVTGMPGNGWYGFSNETLDVLLHRIEADFPPTKSLSVAFSIWGEEGMGTRMGSVSVLKQKGIDSIPSEEGVNRFTRLFIKDPGVHQVIIAARLGGLDTWQWQAKISEPQGRFLEEPLHATPGVESVFQAHLSLETDPYLQDHVFNGSYLFPTVFGLEAMAQAVAHVTGQNDFSRVRIENIQLKRPITVDPVNGAEIVVWAELAEPENSSTLQTIHAGVYKQGATQSSDYFSATFILGLAEDRVEYDINLPKAPLDIQPRQDLYNGRLLFQGPRFQRLQHIYALDSKKCVFDSEFHSSCPDSNEKQWLLGDPYFRDALLHSTQLPVSQHICLPVSIESIDRFNIPDGVSGSLRGVTVIDNQTTEEVHGSVLTTDDNGQVIERLTGYALKIMEHHPEYPSPEDIADPGHRDEMVILDELERRAAHLNIIIPAISVTSLSGLTKSTKERRRNLELPILRKTVKQAFGRSGKKAQDGDITWLASGKPVFAGKDHSGWNLSLSHDRETVVCVAGEGRQGCDIESITNRTREEWNALLGKKRAFLLDELLGDTESIDRAGTRIWVAMEASAKATGSKKADLQIEKRQGDSVLFSASGLDDESFSIVTFPVILTRGTERMIAVTVKLSKEKIVPFLSPRKKSHAENLNFDMKSYRVHIENGPQDQPVFFFHFPVTFKEAANISKTLYFSNYFVWLGKLREYLVQPIYDKLVEYFSTGKWGAVTNHAETRILGEAQPGDVIEGRLWLDRISGKEKSTLDFIFEWRKMNSHKDGELIAASTMSTTWVSNHGHGVVEIESLPEFGLEYFSSLLPPSTLPKIYSPLLDSSQPPDLGNKLYGEPAGPVRSMALLKEKVFETCLEDSNLVGNIYFSNYYIWQGRVRDHFIYEIAPEYFTDSGKHGELRCVRCEINHLSEAMPYDHIAVRMYRSAVYEKGIRLHFDYFKISADGERQKLGYGVHEAIWHAPTSGRKEWLPARLPQKILDAVIPQGEHEVRNVTPRHRVKKDNTYDVIVVGAGIGGLTAAGLLSKNGEKVLVVEQHNKPGGFCTSWERMVKHNGKQLRFVFDAGVHDIAALGDNRYIPYVLRELGVENQIRWLRTDHEYLVNGLRLTVPRRLEDFLELLITKFPAERGGLISIFQEISLCYNELFKKKFPSSSTNSPLAKWRDVSFFTMLESYIHDRTLLQVLSILSCYITDNLSSLSVSAAIPLFSYYIEGGCYPSGGSQVLSDTLAGAIEKFGSEVRLSTPVKRILVKDSRAIGVELKNGQLLHAENIISNADVRRTFLELVGRKYLSQHFSKRIDQLRPSNSAFMVFLCVDYVPEIKPITIYKDEKITIAIMTPSLADPSLAPIGYAGITIITLLSHEQAKAWSRDDSEYKKRKKQYGTKLIEISEKVLPGLSDHILYRQEASPASFSRYAGTTDGAIYGLAIDEWHPPLKTPIEGLFLAGAGTSFHPGVEHAALSGINAANKIITL